MWLQAGRGRTAALTWIAGIILSVKFICRSV